jgi:hypothetical protein
MRAKFVLSWNRGKYFSLALMEKSLDQRMDKQSGIDGVD